MKLYLDNYTITQRFGQNANPYYKNNGLIGHSGLDVLFTGGYDTPILSPCKGVVYKILNQNNPDPMKYRAVCMLIEDSQGTWELIIGHLNKIFISEGLLLAGEPLGTQGNTGEVYSNGILVSAKEKKAGSKAGTHTHIQKRKVERVKQAEQGVQHLDDGKGGLYRDAEGNFYRVSGFNNGFFGCSDPELDLAKPSFWEKLTQITQVLAKLKYLVGKG